jgi:hypothetical protein
VRKRQLVPIRSCDGSVPISTGYMIKIGPRAVAPGHCRPLIASWLTALLAAALTPLALAEPATAEPKPAAPDRSDSLSVADRARMLEQEPYLRLNDRLHDVAAQWKDARFAGSRPDLQQRAIIVYWVGKIPAELARLRAEAAAGGISLIIEPARFSQHQLLRASDEVSAFVEQHGMTSHPFNGKDSDAQAGALTASPPITTLAWHVSKST